MGHALMENRNGLVVDGLISRATGTAERDVAWLMALRREDCNHKITLGADKAYDTREFVADFPYAVTAFGGFSRASLVFAVSLDRFRTCAR